MHKTSDLKLQYNFILYIAGSAHGAAKTIAQVQRLLDDKFDGNFELQIIDILKKPYQAGEAGIFATPTLIKVQPQPTRKVVGRFKDAKAVFAALGI